MGIISNEGALLKRLETIVKYAILASVFGKTCSFDTFFGRDNDFEMSPAWIRRKEREAGAKKLLQRKMLGNRLLGGGDSKPPDLGSSDSPEELPDREVDDREADARDMLKMRLLGGDPTVDPKSFEFYHPDNFIRGLCAAGKLPVPPSLQTSNTSALPLRTDWRFLRSRNLDQAVGDFINAPEKSTLWEDRSQEIDDGRAKAKRDFPSGNPVPAGSATGLGEAVRDARAAFLLAALRCWDDCARGKGVDDAKRDRLSAEHRRCSAMMHYEEMRKLGDAFELDNGNRPWREREALYNQSGRKTDHLYAESEKKSDSRDIRVTIARNKIETAVKIKRDTGLLDALPWPPKQSGGPPPIPIPPPPPPPPPVPGNGGLQGALQILRKELDNELQKGSRNAATIKALRDTIGPLASSLTGLVPGKRAATIDGERVQISQPRRRRLSLSQLHRPGALPGQPPLLDPVRILTCPGYLPAGLTPIPDPRTTTGAEGEANGGGGDKDRGGDTGMNRVSWPRGIDTAKAKEQLDALFAVFDAMTTMRQLRFLLQRPGPGDNGMSGSDRVDVAASRRGFPWPHPTYHPPGYWEL
jgi:hypothetical protein